MKTQTFSYDFWFEKHISSEKNEHIFDLNHDTEYDLSHELNFAAILSKLKEMASKNRNKDGKKMLWDCPFDSIILSASSAYSFIIFQYILFNYAWSDQRNQQSTHIQKESYACAVAQKRETFLNYDSRSGQNHKSDVGKDFFSIWMKSSEEKNPHGRPLNDESSQELKKFRYA